MGLARRYNVEMEYDIACLLRIPRLVYVKKEKGKPKFDVNDLSVSRRRKFLQKIKTDDCTYYSFSNYHDLAVQAAIDIMRHLHDREWKERTMGPDYEDKTQLADQ